MNNLRGFEQYIELVVNSKSFKNESNLLYRLNYLFKDFDFWDKQILEIGGGNGVYSFFAAVSGAKQVINLEPAGDGSTSGVIQKFDLYRKKININNIRLIPTTFQDYNSNGEKFDMILLYDSINHLDERACMNLRHDHKSVENYHRLFTKLFELANANATLIICDCSNFNIFPLLTLRNPFLPNLEWDKHQSPKVWINLLKKVGFVNPKITWSSFNRFGHFGKILLGYKIISFFITSHFCLRMEKK